MLMIFSLTVTAAIETPIIPINPTETASITLSSNADSKVLAGSSVEFTTRVEGISSSGVASAHLVYNYSDCLEFDGEVVLNGLPGWTVSDLKDENNTLSFDISGPEIRSDFAVKFTFNVSLAPTPRPSVRFDSAYLYSEEGRIVNATKSSSNNSFNVESVVPSFDNLGASLRINNTPALRFGMMVKKDEVYKSAFGNGSYSYSSSDKIKFGMLCIAKDKLDGALTVDTEGVYVKNFTSALIDNTNEVVFVYQYDNLGSNTMEFVTRPFITYELDNGEKVYFYGAVKTRSAEYVAEVELKSETDSKKKELLKKFISK